MNWLSQSCSESKPLLNEAVAGFNYPIFLNLQDRLVVVVGAGTVGRRKLRRLLQVGAHVRLVDPLLAETSHPEAVVESIGRSFVAADLQGAQLVFACTNSSLVNQQISEAAVRQNVLCCRADHSATGDFILPAVFSQGRLGLAVSTGGSSPTLAVEIRDRLAAEIPDFWGVSLEIMAGIRRKKLTTSIDDQYNQQVLRSFWGEQLLPLLEDGNMNKINQLLVETFGDEFSLELLQVQLPEGMS